MNVGHVYTVPLATYEGRIILGEDSDIPNNGQIATEFVGENITGSQTNIESLTCLRGRIFGTLTGIDRIGHGLYKNMEIKGIHNIFEAGIKYFD